jgi:hypothetical protein
MSLVSEALKKAQREAAAREAREAGLPEPLSGSPQPFRRRRGTSPAGLATGVVVGLALAAAGAWLFLRAGGGEPAPARPVAPKPTPIVAAAPAVPTAEPTATAPPAVPVATATPAPPPAPPPSAPATPPVRPTSFVREAPLADGRTIRLGGIAYSEAAPLAYLNGRLLGVGERVEGCTVARVARTEVRLACDAEEIVIGLK